MPISTEVVRIVDEVDSILRRDFSKQLFYPKEVDQIRLLKLKMWSERYSVSIAYILSKLIPYFAKLSAKHSRRPQERVSKGIGTTISVLTGQAAEAFLQQAIEKEFPDGEHIIAWKETKRAECLLLIEKDEGDITSRKPKSILQYPTLASFRRAYEKRITNNRRVADKLVRQLSRQPWRGNPFR
jgi:uncharacterized SAM-dependent methyltransferase